MKRDKGVDVSRLPLGNHEASRGDHHRTIHRPRYVTMRSKLKQCLHLLRRLIGLHEFRRAGLSRQTNAIALASPEVVSRFVVAIDESIDILELHPALSAPLSRSVSNSTVRAI
jgi:hypothetical protein